MLRLIALPLIDTRIAAAKRQEFESSGRGLWRERVDHSVHSSPCAFHRTVRHVLSGNGRIFRHVPRSVDRPSLKAAETNAEREKY